MKVRLPRPLLALGLMLLASGCSTLEPRITDFGPVYTPTNVQGPAAWPQTIRRVAVLPAHDTSGRLPADFIRNYDSIWRRMLDRSQRAEFVGLTRAEITTWTGRASYGANSLLPPTLLSRIARETDAQAVFFLDLNHCTPYPPLVLSFRARLVDLTTGETLWMVDEIFDSSSAPTARAARRYARANSSGVGDATSGILQSPSIFAEYAFLAVGTLLPSRVAAPTPSAKP